jgi:uncharacterized protein (DUF2141 family)
MMLRSVVFMVLFACSVPLDNERRDQRQFPARAAIRGTLVYQGPRPCTKSNKVVGAAIVLVYPKSNPPPPSGTADRPVNFAVVSGEDLFAAEPRFSGVEPSCPDERDVVSVSAPYAISPLDAGEYIVSAFYERSGNFLPSFSTHNQPESGDVLGGYLDVARARAGVPALLPVVLGEPDASGVLRVPARGFVADGILVTLLQRTAFMRPIFTLFSSSAPANGATPENASADPEYVPAAIMTQDHRTLAFPQTVTQASLDALAKSYVSMRLNYGVAPGEEANAVAEAPFNFAINPRAGFSTFVQAVEPRTNLASLWPQPSFARLLSDRARDPQSVLRAKSPTVVLAGLTLLDDSLFANTQANVPRAPVAKDHLSVLVRPYALCIPASGPPGIIVTPYKTGRSSDPSGSVDKPLYDDAALLVSARGLANEVRTSCLPPGRYAVSLTYPTGQSWTLPNEAGACAISEGAESGGQCSRKPRPVLGSQGTTRVLEIVPPTTPEGRAFCEGEGRVDPMCVP